MKKVLITGAAGFVGKNLIPLLVEGGYVHELFLVDLHTMPHNILRDIKPTDVKIHNFRSNRLPLLNHDQVDAIICLAGATSVDAALEEPKKAIDKNIAIASDIAEWARRYNPEVKIIYMSSDEVLGESIVDLNEEAPLNPTQPYAASKAAAEVVLHNYRDVYKLKIVTIRSCNLVGAFQKKPKLIPNSVDAILSNRPIPIQGDGNQLREWMAVEDLCNAIVLLLQNDVTAQIYQATSHVKISVNSIVRIVSEEFGVDLKTESVPDRLVQDRCYAMQTTRLNTLGWYPDKNPFDAIKNAAHLIAIAKQTA